MLNSLTLHYRGAQALFRKAPRNGLTPFEGRLVYLRWCNWYVVKRLAEVWHQLLVVALLQQSAHPVVLVLHEFGERCLSVIQESRSRIVERRLSSNSADEASEEVPLELHVINHDKRRLGQGVLGRVGRFLH